MGPRSTSIPTSTLDWGLRKLMHITCTTVFGEESSTPPTTLNNSMKHCKDAPARSSTVPSPYSDSYRYCGVEANAMYYQGGDSEWANEVRGCLTCMDEMDVAPHDAHMFCYKEGTDKAGSLKGTLQGYREAIETALKNYGSQIQGWGRNLVSNVASTVHTGVLSIFR